MIDWMRLTNNPMPVCPYCGHEAKCVADLTTQDGIESGDGLADCDGCERTYRVTLEVVHLFTTRPLDPVREESAR